MTGPTLTHQVRLSYLNIIPTSTKEYHVEIGTITFDDWVNQTTLSMNQLYIPFITA